VRKKIYLQSVGAFTAEPERVIDTLPRFMGIVFGQAP
jgi:hypothetical protein